MSRPEGAKLRGDEILPTANLKHSMFCLVIVVLPVSQHGMLRMTNKIEEQDFGGCQCAWGDGPSVGGLNHDR